MANVTMVAPATSPPGTPVLFRDGTSGTVGAAGTLSVPAGFVASMLDAGFTMPPATVQNGSNVAVSTNKNTTGTIPLIFRIDIAAGALADTDVVMTQKIRVINAWLILTGAGVSTTTLQVKNTATAITDAMAASGAAKALVRAATIDSASYEIAAGGILRVTSATGATQPAATVYVEAVLVP